MPCTYYNLDEEIKLANRQVEIVEAYLCGVLTELQKRGLEADVLKDVDWAEVGVLQKDFNQWWKQHQEQDARQRKYEQQEKRRQAKLEEKQKLKEARREQRMKLKNI